MASSYSTDLKLELMVTGENAGLWGDITNTNLNILQQAIAGYQTVALNATTGATLTFTNGALSNGKNAVLKLTGTITGNVDVIIPDSGSGTAPEKVYLIENGTVGAYTVTVKTTSGTGVTFGATDKGKRLLYSDGTNIVDSALQSLSSDYTPTLSANLSTNSKNIIIGSTYGIIDENANEQIKFSTTASATNEITIANAAAGNSPVISATGGDTNVGITLTPKGDLGRITANGETKIFGVFENATITTTFQTTLNYDILTQAVLYANVVDTSNFTVNLRGNSSTALNAALATGESVTVALLNKNDNTTYYNNVIQVDGTTVTAIWQGGSAPTAGNASSTDVYSYTALKTAASTYVVLASITQFK
jgi:hypothetical protein